MRILFALLLSAGSLFAQADYSTLLLLPWPPATGGGGSVAIDSVGTAGSGGGGDTVICTNVVGSGSGRLLIVAIHGGDSTIGDRTVDSVISDLDGAFTHLAADSDDGAFCRTEIWYKVNPSTGTHSITNRFTSGGSTSTKAAQAISFNGVNAGTPFGTPVIVNGTVASTGPTSGSLTIGAGELGLAVISSDSGPTLTQNAGTSRWNILNIVADTSFGGATIATTGAISWTTANETYGLSAVVIKP